ncbi:MAG: 50S ribosomal protein L21 [Bacteroidetes bacterium]|nr:50S ribosomal protein L21 [Bacteroidota bacterium]MDA0874082.1 50S ribosomal protein L21 [Bacteroidota bacterium]
MYAIVEIAGKQYKVSQDDTLYVPRQKAQANDKLSFDKVLLVHDGTSVSVGTPTVEGITVDATVLDQVKADKVLVFKKKRRKRYKVKNGHRQPYTQIKIDAIGKAKKAAAKKKAEPKAEEAAPADAE